MDEAEIERALRDASDEYPSQSSWAKDGGQGSKENEQQSREAEARDSMLSQIFEPDAYDRLKRIRIGKNESNAKKTEDHFIMLARTGRLRKRVSDEDLVEFLTALSKQENQQDKGKVTFVRRQTRYDDEFDDDDDDYESNSAPLSRSKGKSGAQDDDDDDWD